MSLSVQLTHDFGGFRLQAGFEAPPGLTVLFGRSGSGKTTVINAVAGLMRPQSGRITLNDQVLLDTGQGVDLPVHRRRLGYIFQEARLFPHMTVRRNLGYGARFSGGRVPRADWDRVIDMLGIGPLLERRPGALSGGEKQRVAIGRALLARPAILLADEPLAALDAARKAEILPYFERLRDEAGLPILYVTHSPEELARLATTIVAMKEGRVDRAGPAAKLLADPGFTPTGPRDAGAVLTARVRAHHGDGLTELVAGGLPLLVPGVDLPVGHGLRLRIAAQDVIIARTRPQGLSALNILPGTVATIREGEGPGALVAIDTPAGTVLSRITRRSVAALNLAPGQPCHAVLKTVSIAPNTIGAA